MATTRIWLFIAALAVAGPARAADPPDSLMYHDPDLPVARVVPRLPARLPEMWFEALGRPEADVKCEAAQAIARAHERGLPGMAAGAAALARELGRPNQHPTVRLAVARALVAIDAREAAPALARAAAADPDLLEVVDPALARWDYRPARAVWLERLAGPKFGRGTVQAIRALASIRDEGAAPRFRDLAVSRSVPAAIRIEAARAVAALRPTGLEADARALSADGSPQGLTDRLVAATLRRQHRGDDAVRLLQTLGRDPEGAVAAVALARLIELGPDLVVPLLDTVLASPDAIVRRQAVAVLAVRPSEAHVGQLGDRLTDPAPAVRARARAALRDLGGRPEWKAAVVREATRVLAGADWRGLEQAAILSAELGHRPAVGRLTELLGHDRPEVFVAAAWGLRKLAVADAAPAALTYFEEQYRQLADPSSAATRRSAGGALDRQLSHLAQFLGVVRHRPADELFRRLAPKADAKTNPAGAEARAAAIWALGLLHEGKPVPELTRVLFGRLTAVRPFDLEDERVRRMSAVTLGRTKAFDMLASLREFYRPGVPSLSPVNYACAWAIEQMTGEKMGPPGVLEVVERDWFLAPTD
jgi:HEAT repeat protein